MRPASTGLAGFVMLLIFLVFALVPGEWFSCEFWLGSWCS